MKSLGHVQAILSWLRALQLVVGANRSQQRRQATCLRTGRCAQSVRLLPSVVPANSVQVSHRRPTPAFSWSQVRGSCLGPGSQSFQPACEEANKPMLLGVTVHWAEVYLRIWEEHFPQWRGHTQAPSNRKSRIPTAVIGGCSWCVLLGQQESTKVLSTLKGLPRLPEQGFGGRDRHDVRTADRWASQ